MIPCYAHYADAGTHQIPVCWTSPINEAQPKDSHGDIDTAIGGVYPSGGVIINPFR
jgi:hypothetical protein